MTEHGRLISRYARPDEKIAAAKLSPIDFAEFISTLRERERSFAEDADRDMMGEYMGRGL